MQTYTNSDLEFIGCMLELICYNMWLSLHFSISERILFWNEERLWEDAHARKI